MDKSGFALTLTTTVNLLFGSGLMVPETGVIMNNEMNGKELSTLPELLTVNDSALLDFSIPGSSNAFGYSSSLLPHDTSPSHLQN